MAYMHKETFKIYAENSIVNPDDYFEVDELIALPIQTLNRKGYITMSCCAGHPFVNLVDIRIQSPDLGSHIVYESEDTTIKGPHRTIIAFEEKISFPTLPPNFAISETEDKRICIERHYDDNDVYGIMREILGSMEQLYEWTLDLPDYKK